MVVDLPEPFGPRNPVTIPGLHHEIQSVHGKFAAIPLAEIVNFDHRAALAGTRPAADRIQRFKNGC
jgi:hypothetical protein